MPTAAAARTADVGWWRGLGGVGHCRRNRQALSVNKMCRLVRALTLVFLFEV